MAKAVKPAKSGENNTLGAEGEGEQNNLQSGEQGTGGELGENGGENGDQPGATNGGENAGEQPAVTSPAPEQPAPPKNEEPVKTAVVAPQKKIRIRAMVTDTCDVGQQRYHLRKGEELEVPADVCAILQNSGWAVRIS